VGKTASRIQEFNKKKQASRNWKQKTGSFFRSGERTVYAEGGIIKLEHNTNRAPLQSPHDSRNSTPQVGLDSKTFVRENGKNWKIRLYVRTVGDRGLLQNETGHVVNWVETGKGGET